MGTMRLTRRDALVVLGGLAVGAGGVGSGEAAEIDVTDERVAAATAAAEVVYPSAVDVDREFVQTFLFERAEPRPGHFEGLADSIDAVERFARARFGERFASLSPGDRRRAFDRMGVYASHANPDGTTASRVRHYLVNDLLYALFTHPKGGDLLGVPNPPGHPGGTELYQRGPTE